MEDIQEARKIFLADDIDPETREENEEKIKEWEQTLIQNEAFLSWTEHDITRQIVAQARETYKEISLNLAMNRKLTSEERASLWARQDAALWILSISNKDAKSIIEGIRKEIKTAIKTV